MANICLLETGSKPTDCVLLEGIFSRVQDFKNHFLLYCKLPDARVVNILHEITSVGPKTALTWSSSDHKRNENEKRRQHFNNVTGDVRHWSSDFLYSTVHASACRTCKEFSSRFNKGFSSAKGHLNLGESSRRIIF
jgi:hypothetical protein